MFAHFGIKDILDILIVATLLYSLYRLMKESGSINIFTGVLIFIGVWVVVTRILDMKLMGAIMDKLTSVRLTPDAATQQAFAALNEPCPSQAVTLADLGRRPQLPLRRLSVFLPELEETPENVLQETETILRYSGYLELQDELVRRAARQEAIRLPADMDYTGIAGLSREIQEKLNAIRPLTLGQAGRISGVTPAALACVEIELKKRGLLQKTEENIKSK